MISLPAGVRPWLALIAALLLFCAGYALRGLQCRVEQQHQAAQQAQAAQRASEQARKKEQAAAQGAVSIAKNLQEQNQNAKNSTDQLRTDVRNGTKRLSIRTRPVSVPATAAGTGRDITETRVDIHPETADDLIALTAEADDVVRQLTACQALTVEDRELVNAD